MKVSVTTYIKPLHWNSLPDEELVFDLNNEMERRFFIRQITNIESDEYITIQEYEKKEEGKL